MIVNRGQDATNPVALSQVEPDGSYFVENVSGPEAQRHRLSELGIIAGTPLSIISRGREGMLVVKVGGSRMALSSGMSDHVWVYKSPS